VSDDLLSVTILDRGADLVITVSGELDFGTSSGFHAALHPLAQAGRTLILDLAELVFCDSTGLGALVRLHKLSETSGGELSLARLRPQIDSAIRLTMLHRLLHIIPEVPASA
jgi:anti-sigma B factor antagonist